MREALAKALGVSAEKDSFESKTNEGVDAIGRGEAMRRMYCYVVSH